MSRFILLSFLLALPALGETARDPSLVPPRPATWSDLREAGFDPSWRLADALPQAQGCDGQPREDLADEIQRLARLEVVEDGERFTFGDLLAELAPLRRDARASAQWLSRAHLDHAELFAQAGLPLDELLLSARLYGDDWCPDDEERDDGLMEGPPLSLASVAAPPWCDVGDEPRVQQVAALVFAGAADVLAVAHDFDGYRDHVGADYRGIAPRPGCHWRGSDPQGMPFVAVLLDISCDLPFPFGGYSLALWVLDQVQPDGGVVTHLYTRSPDFHWLAGRDLLVPVLDGRGRCVATLAVRQQGFDLAGVPEGDDVRRATLRAGLGNFKRRAEVRADQRAAEPVQQAAELCGPQPPELPPFEVHGTPRS